MSKYGCPLNCPDYTEPKLTGFGTFGGVVLGGLFGLLGGPIGVLAGAIIGGLLGTALEATSLTSRLEQLVNEAKIQGKEVKLKILT